MIKTDIHENCLVKNDKIKYVRLLVFNQSVLNKSEDASVWRLQCLVNCCKPTPWTASGNKGC